MMRTRQSRSITYSNRLQDKIDDLSAKDQQIMLAYTPALERQGLWRRIVTGGYTDDEIRSSLDRISFAMDRAEDHLADRPWLAGAQYSLADIAMLAIIHRYRELYPELIAPKDYPRINEWLYCMMARPAVAWVYSVDTEEVPGHHAGKSVAGIGG
jgi:glutathione S-transferase